MDESRILHCQRYVAYLTIFLLVSTGLGCGGSNTDASNSETTESTSNTTQSTYNSYLTRIDDVLSSNIEGGVFYDVPGTMHREETVDIQVQLILAQSGDDLSELILQEGLVCAEANSSGGERDCRDVEITDQFRATLRAANSDAFEIRPGHETSVQIADVFQPSEWEWSITPLSPGRQVLTFNIQRMVAIDGINSWRQVESSKHNLTVETTFIQWLLDRGWVWLLIPLASLLFAILIGNRRAQHPLAGASSSLSSAEYERIRQILLRCGSFHDANALRAVFADPRVRHWRDHLGDGHSIVERLESSMDFLSARTNSAGENGLILLIQVLRDRLHEEDRCHADLDQIVKDLTNSA